MLARRRSGDRVLVTVHVGPRASSNVVGGEREGALRVRVTAAPADGKANALVMRVLAKALDVRRRRSFWSEARPRARKC